MSPPLSEPLVLVAAPAFPAGVEICKALHGADIDAALVETAGEVLRRARDQSIGVLVIDMSLPDVDCIGLIPLVRELQKDVPVIVCTGEPSPEEEAAVRRVEVSFYAIRPYDLDHLAELVERNRNSRGGVSWPAREALAGTTQGGR